MNILQRYLLFAYTIAFFTLSSCAQTPLRLETGSEIAHQHTPLGSTSTSNKEVSKLLTWASKYHKPLYKFLTTNVGSIDDSTRRGITALQMAIRCNSLSIVQLLLSQGARIDTVDELGNNPMHYAMMYHSPGIMRCLIFHELSLKRKDKLIFSIQHILPSLALRRNQAGNAPIDLADSLPKTRKNWELFLLLRSLADYRAIKRSGAPLVNEYATKQQR